MRKILIAVGVLVVIVGGAAVYLMSNLDSLVKTAIEKVGTQVAGVPVSVAEAKIDIKEGRGTIKGLTIANPKGFTTPTALSLGEVTVGIDTGSIMKNPIVISDVLVTSPAVTYEMGAGGSNLDVLQNNLRSANAGAKSEPAGNKSSEAKKLVVSKVLVKDGQITLATPLPGGKATVPLPDIHLADIGKSSGGADPADVARQMLDAIANSAMKGVSSLGIGNLVQGAQGAAQDAMKSAPGVDDLQGGLMKTLSGK